MLLLAQLALLLAVAKAALGRGWFPRKATRVCVLGPVHCAAGERERGCTHPVTGR